MICESAGDSNRAAHLLVELHRVRVLGEERRIAREHLEDEHAERVPVDRLVVAFRLDDLGREVVGRAAERPRDVGAVAREAKVGEADVPVGRQQDVLRLEVAGRSAVARAISAHR